MKTLLSLFVFVLAIALTACNKDTASSDEAREELNGEAAVTTPVTPQTASANKTATPALSTTGKANTESAAVVPQGPTTDMTFEVEEHDFGTITEGETVSHKFSFTNTGDEPLIITNAKGSCGCTVPKYPKEAIAPGDEGEILVSFNSKGKLGNNNKTVTLTANVPTGSKILKIKANVLKPSAQ